MRYHPILLSSKSKDIAKERPENCEPPFYGLEFGDWMNPPRSLIRGPQPSRHSLAKDQLQSLVSTPRRAVRSSGVSRSLPPVPHGRSARCSELSPLFEAFDSLSASYRRFTSKTPPKLIDIEFSRQFQAVKDSFEVFTHQATTSLSALNGITERQSAHSASALNIAGRTLGDEWINFIDELNHVFDSELAVHTAEIASLFQDLYEHIDRCDSLVLETSFRTDSSPARMRELRTLCNQVRHECSEVFMRPKAARFTQFNFERFNRQVLDIIRLIQQLFDQSARRFSHIPGESSLLRTCMAGEVSEIAVIMTAAECFPARMKSLKKWVLRFNHQLSEFHRRLGIPFSVHLTATPLGHGELEIGGSPRSAAQWAIIDSDWQNSQYQNI